MKSKKRINLKENIVSTRLNDEEFERFEMLVEKYDSNNADMLREFIRIGYEHEDSINIERLKERKNHIFDPDTHTFSSFEFIDSLLTEDDYLDASVAISASAGLVSLFPGMKVEKDKENSLVIFHITEKNEFQLEIERICNAQIITMHPDGDMEQEYKPKKLWTEQEFVMIWTW